MGKIKRPTENEMVKLMKAAMKEESSLEASAMLGFGTSGYWPVKKGRSTKPREVY